MSPYRTLLMSLFLSGCAGAAVRKPPPVATPLVLEAPRPPEVVQLTQTFRRVYYDFDQAGLSEQAKQALAENAALLQEHPQLRLEIQGHADERGSTDYNLALGIMRAQAVASYLTAQGVAPSRIKVVSFGEERPLRPGAGEAVWSQNRRCEFIILWAPPDISIKGTSGEPQLSHQPIPTQERAG